MTEGEILRRARDGDREAFEAVVLQYHATLHRVALRMLGDPMDAQDAVQDALLRALRAIGRYDPQMPVRAWLLTILINQCRTRYRERQRRRQTFVARQELIDEHPAPTHEASHEVEQIMAAVGELPQLLREAFIFKYVEELEYHEMSAITGAGISALKMRVKRACESLRPRLERMYGDRP